MDQIYSIDEILSAVNEIQNKKKEGKKNKSSTLESINKNYSEVPKHTLRLIEEAEKTK